jgi:hypothetical protein
MTKDSILIQTREPASHLASPSILPPLLGIPDGTCNCPNATAKGFVSAGLRPGSGTNPPPGKGIFGGGGSGIPGTGPPDIRSLNSFWPDPPTQLVLGYGEEGLPTTPVASGGRRAL